MDEQQAAEAPSGAPKVWTDERGEKFVEVDGAFYSIGWGDEAALKGREES